MCGIYAFVSSNPKEPEPNVLFLRAVARAAGQRGPHSWGVAAGDHGSTFISQRKGPGQIEDAAGFPWTSVRGPLIGHARLATSGSLALQDAQPMKDPTGRVHLVHNGNVHRHRELAALYGLPLTTACDSELIAQIMAAHPIRTAIAALGPAPFALAAIVDGVLVVAHHGLPLFSVVRPEGTYYCSVAIDGMEPVPEEEVVAHALAGDPQRSSPPKHPVDAVRWVDPSTLHANDYNPNRVFPPEMELLKISIIEDGWTQPVVARADGEVVDGFHRWTLAKLDPDIRAKSGGLVPVVFIAPGDRASQMMATVRHNRARGAHGVLKMADIVRQLQAAGVADDEITRRLGMEQEEIDRLADARGNADLVGKDSFGKGWIPDAIGTPKE